MDQTRSHLDLLGIFHYIVGTLTLICGLGYGAMILGMVGLMKSVPMNARDAPPPEMFWVFGGMGVVIVGTTAATGAMTGIAGWCLRERRAWTYCLAVAALSLLSFPIGTALGVFTLIVLLRPEAKALFTGGGGTRS